MVEHQCHHRPECCQVLCTNTCCWIKMTNALQNQHMRMLYQCTYFTVVESFVINFESSLILNGVSENGEFPICVYVLQSSGISQKSGALIVRYSKKKKWISFVFYCSENQTEKNKVHQLDVEKWISQQVTFQPWCVCVRINFSVALHTCLELI